MQELWERIEIWLRRHAPHILEGLNEGASEEQIKAFRNRFGASLPEDLVAFYRVHDGQREGSSGLFFGLPFLPIADVLRNHDQWSELLDMNEELAEDMRSYPAGVIKKRYANLGWIPVTHDYGGNHIGIDLDPGWRGRRGQVIIFGRDEDLKKRVAASFRAFVKFFVTQLEEGNYDFDGEQLFIKRGRDGRLIDPQVRHFHNIFEPEK